MRRLLPPLLLLPLLLGVAAPPAAAQAPSPSPAPSSAPSPSPSPAPSPTQAVSTVTLADDGRTVRLRPGQRLQVSLAPTSGAVWQGLERGAPTLHLLAYATGEQQGLSASLQALSPGRFGGSSEVRPQELRAELVQRCTASSPACPAAPRTWSVQVVVEDGPTDTSDVACTPTSRPTASAAPGTVVLTEDDDGRTVTVPRDGFVVVQLDSRCTGTDWTPPRADAPLFRESARVERSRGQVDASFRPQATGTSRVTAAVDARCLHRTDAAGNGTCAVVQRAYSVTVQVAAAPSPSPTVCAKPVYEGFGVTPDRIAAGDPVALEGGFRDLCKEESQETEKQFTLLSRVGSGEERVEQAPRARYFRAELRPRETTTYRLVMDGRQVGQPRTVVVDRVSGSCLGAVSLGGPSTATPGARADLGGYSATPGATVRVLFKRYGAPGYTVRRTVTAASDGRFRVSFVVADDHRWYAATDRCDSPAGLTRARPRITGPAVVRRGETVTLRVEAVRGVRTTVFFRGAGEAFTARRTLTGPGTVTYTATRDQRWYAQTRDLASGAGLTQVR